ncbi:hypothetical protein LPW11_21925 [Geomonas sp. RF6]|uniref:hypothetical protein n=1 Tax=Geomonas sp. RF6 TaxID=2897342 RepID=UPI001E358816|nr:hypothetical protein [Geomonas sp. RF6]UFS70514.1 hypothetical protein LPW11_21925 [Geomonas sp. RF6]
MIWLVVITITLLITKVILATLIPSARRKAEETLPLPKTVVAQEGQWLTLTDIHSSGAPVRVRVRTDDPARH